MDAMLKNNGSDASPACEGGCDYSSAPRAAVAPAERWESREDLVLTALWLANVAVPHIVAYMNPRIRKCTAASIAIRATRLELPRRKDPIKDAAQAQAIIAGIIGQLEQTNFKLQAKPGCAGLRKCLNCSTPFYSAGSHNRICMRCKGSNQWRYN
jgi:hypothetical protein